MSAPDLREQEIHNEMVRERLAERTAELAQRLDVKSQLDERMRPLRARVDHVRYTLRQLADHPKARAAGAALAGLLVLVLVRRRHAGQD